MQRASEMVVAAPQTTFKQIPRFNLANLRAFFNVPEYQRPKSDIHVNRIVDAIMSNKFYDNIIRVVKSNDNQGFNVIDGQHKLAALWICHTEHALEEYGLILQIFDADFAREVFRKINMGKPLSANDHTRALDDGSHKFFTEFSDVAAHKGTDKKLAYVNMLSALYYAKEGRAVPASPQRLEYILGSINPFDMTKMRQVTDVVRLDNPTLRDNPVVKPMVFRNLFKIAYEYDLDSVGIMSLLNGIMENSKVKWRINQGQGGAKISEAYDIIVKEVFPKIGLVEKCGVGA